MKGIGFILCGVLILSSCTGIPEGIQPITHFEIEKYLGQWYEIARLDHSFERGMAGVTATYSMREDGGIKVLNEGFLANENFWDQAEGKAYFISQGDVAHLKVSFFGPFYGSYIVFQLGDNYDYAFVTSTNKSYLWFLSREAEINESLKQEFIELVTGLDYKIDELIWVDHNIVKD
ncbi:MAG: lipocalin family protein [Gammaproteobacteria bacterium]|nr:lipocalin family protein [Gammaproteobacteria bacterium]